MRVAINDESFDELQNFLTTEIIASVHRGLQDLRLPREQLQDAISTIAFNVCCAIDGSTIMHVDGRRVIPVLTFSRDAEFEEVVSCGSTSFMHEYVHGATEEYLSRDA